jgi:hypothetical protein
MNLQKLLTIEITLNIHAAKFRSVKVHTAMPTEAQMFLTTSCCVHVASVSYVCMTC